MLKKTKKELKVVQDGVATLFYEYILGLGGVAYGANNIENGMFEFIRIDNAKELYKLKQSKYVHCYINKTYEMAKKDLENGKKVMFVGTPCQISGLKAYLRKNYENLYTADLVCHGVPSQKLVSEQVKYDYNLDMKEIDNIRFRNKTDFTMNAFKDGVMLSKKRKNNYYMNEFSNCNIFRNNCYDCKYATTSRVSDITIGDFWGLDEHTKICDDIKKGISVVLPISEKGLELINGIKENICIEQRTISEAIAENEQLKKPATKKREYYKFRKLYPQKGYIKTMKRLVDKKKIIKKKIKSNKFIYKVYKILKEFKEKI